MKQATKQDIASILADLLNQILRSPLNTAGTEELAMQFGYSRSHLTRVLQEVCGESLGVLHRRIRLERAGYALKQGRSVQEASMLAGFGSPEAFCRSFKRAYHVVPGQFAATKADWKLPTPDGLHWNELWDETFESKKLAVKYETQLERCPPFRVAVVRHVGTYARLWEGWEKMEFIEGKRWVTIYLDNLWTCPHSDLMRSDLGFVLLPGEQPPKGYKLLEIPTQLTVKTKRYVERTERNELWSYLCGVWPNSTLSWDEYEAWPLPFEEVRTKACLGFR